MSDGYIGTHDVSTDEWKCFLQFLELNNLKAAYCHHLAMSGKNLLHRLRIGEYKPSRYVDMGFFWHSTPQGTCYWAHVDRHWRQVCTNPKTMLSLLKEYRDGKV